jgi:hypothetical protein
LIRRASEAKRRAFVAFGGVTQHTESLRDGRGMAWIGSMRLDLVLGIRMALKVPMSGSAVEPSFFRVSRSARAPSLVQEAS